MSSSSGKSLASRAQKNAVGAGCLRLFFVPFFLIGVGFFYALTVRPMLLAYSARQWLPTPCVIDSSEVVSHSDSDGSTYSVAITYSYRFAGQPYTSQRYHFGVGSTGGRKGKDDIVRRFPAGSEAVCYVNPAAPQEAVLDRAWQMEYAFGAVGLLFAVAGGMGLIFAPRWAGGKRTTSTTNPSAPLTGTGLPGVLTPKSTPMGKFLGILTFSIVWNAFIGVFIFFLFFVNDPQRIPIFAKAIFAILALVGVGTIIGVFTTFLALFNPRIRIAAQSTTIPLGGELQITWTVSGRTGMLRKVRMTFEGREEATHQRGTNSTTDTQVFAEIPVFESADREFLSQGSARVTVPAGLMHTFEGGRNKVLWRLKVQGEIPRWPDVADEYPIVVLPLNLRY